ncbi:Golgi-associated plant pathogenesis-related protein 1-like [Andrena cerasifolii]|uniref:Golgi-associated plant pathogenesis-related protein 1-like n=1 Tax=Andrena cerasifolii TaxID=2819439 RepID=UPI004037BA63
MDRFCYSNFPPNFVGCFLKLHNQYRARHKSPPLKLDKKLSEYAQEWAESLAERGVLCYRPDTKYGENIFVSFWRNVPHRISPKDPIDAWYREGKYFKYGDPTPKNLKDVRHFTQLVWAGTKTMGLGMATAANGKIYLVCNYHPRGNVSGEFASNVMPSSQVNGLFNHQTRRKIPDRQTPPWFSIRGVV